MNQKYTEEWRLFSKIYNYLIYGDPALNKEEIKIGFESIKEVEGRLECMSRGVNGDTNPIGLRRFYNHIMEKETVTFWGVQSCIWKAQAAKRQIKKLAKNPEKFYRNEDKELAIFCLEMRKLYEQPISSD